MCTLHRDDILFPCNDSCHFDRAFNSFRSRVPEVERVKGRVRHHREEPINELQIRTSKTNATLDINSLSRKEGKNISIPYLAVNEFQTLLSSSSADLGMTMS